MRTANIMSRRYFLARQRQKRIKKAMYDGASDTLEKVAVGTIGSWMPLLAEVPAQSMAARMAEAIQAILSEQKYRLKSDGQALTISGGSEVAVLYGAYAFAEKLGVRFQLDGDVIPDARIPFSLPPHGCKFLLLAPQPKQVDSRP